MAVRRLTDAAGAEGARRSELPGVARSRRPTGGPVRAGATAGRDPEEERRKGMFCDCAIPRTAGKAPVWDTTLAVGEGERFARRGAEIFARNCAGCHGQEGLGDGPAAVALTPAPRNLATARFSDRSLSESLWNGVRARPCPPGATCPRRIDGARGLLKTIAPTEPPPELTAAERTMARQPSTSNSAPFATGRTGPATGLRRRSWRRPRRTSTRSGPRRTTPEAALTNGVRGTAMPKWGRKLTPDEQLLLARYVRSFSNKAVE